MALAVTATVGSLTAQAPTPPAPATAPTFPIPLITGDGEGPALFLGSTPDTAGVGYVSPNVPVELVEPPANGRALVRIRGAMRVRAYLPTERLAAIVQRRGRIRGTPIYVGPGSRVRVIAFEPDGRVRVAARVTIGARTFSYEGSFPAVGLGATTPEATPDALPPGAPHVIRLAQPTGLLETPNGRVIETLPAGDYACRVVDTQNGFHSVIIGEGAGPFLTGFVAGELAAPVASPGAPPPRVAAAFPRRLRADGELPLVHVAAGTRVTFEGETIALLDRPGYARVVERHDATNEADVFVAVDDDVAVRGMVEIAALGDSVH